MMLGEFRKITEKYDDNCVLCYASGYSGVNYPNFVDRVIIDIGSATEAEPEPVPNIVVI